MLFAVTWMQLEIITLSEVRKRQAGQVSHEMATIAVFSGMDKCH